MKTPELIVTLLTGEFQRQFMWIAGTCGTRSVDRALPWFLLTEENYQIELRLSAPTYRGPNSASLVGFFP